MQVVYHLFSAITGQVLVFLMIFRHSKAFSSLMVTLTDEHLTLIVVACETKRKCNVEITLLINAFELIGLSFISLLTLAGDCFSDFVTTIGVNLSVRIVQDWSAHLMLLGITKALVMNLTASVVKENCVI